MLKIIAGTARGTVLDVVPGLNVRPTAERVRKAMFDSLRDFDGLSVADLYAGSGALGLEAASRGAAAVLLVEQAKRHAAIIRGNIEKIKKLGVTVDIEVRCTPSVRVETYASVMPRPNLIFADPPYAESAAEFARLMTSEAFLRWAAGALLLWEMPTEAHEYKGFVNVDIPGESGFRRYEGVTFMEVRLNNKSA